jgi:HSP20 family molecular chaperone IbpA
MAGTLTRWDPFAELGELRTRFDRIVDDWLDGRERAWTPAIDVVREDGHLVVRADLPGIKPEEVKIEVEDDILTVSGEHEERKDQEEKNFVRREPPLRVLLTFDGGACGRRSEDDRGQDALRCRRNDTVVPSK